VLDHTQAHPPRKLVAYFGVTKRTQGENMQPSPHASQATQTTPANEETPAQRSDSIDRFRRVRAATEAIAKPLSAEDCQVQSMPDASPIKWHLAHTTWFFETFVLCEHLPGYCPFHDAYKVLFNSYYNGIGEKHPRAQRGLLSRPSLADVLAYRAHVNENVERLLRECDLAANAQIASLMLLGFNHEEQHQELMFTDVKHMLSLNPLAPTYASAAPHASAPQAQSAAIDWIAFDGGTGSFGFDRSHDFCFDNELPRHQALLAPYRIANRLVTNGEYLSFMQDGGYGDHSLWLSDGWDWVQSNAIRAPMYWRSDDLRTWREFTLLGLLNLDLNAPVSHVNYFEADAFARWAGVRLPTEFEWEHAVSHSKAMLQIDDALWQWTASAYLPYPGFAPKRGAVGEYNGKFMSQQSVLRGGSRATPRGHSRTSYRNFFQPDKRWQFTGIRLAK
jgi:ergothioneine biosynthesis protein EgtB